MSFKLNFDNIIAKQKAVNVNPDSFMAGKPAFKLQPDTNPDAKKCVNSILFNDEAIEALGLYQAGEDGSRITNVVLFPNYRLNEKNPNVALMAATIEKNIDTGTKKFKSYTVAETTQRLQSNPMFETLVTRFGLDAKAQTIFVLNEVKTEDVAGVFIVTPLVVPNEGKDVAITKVETSASIDDEAHVVAAKEPEENFSKFIGKDTFDEEKTFSASEDAMMAENKFATSLAEERASYEMNQDVTVDTSNDETPF